MTLVILIHALVFLAFWLTNLSYQMSLNDFLISATGLRANYLLICLVFAGLVALWSAARLALRRDARRAGPAWLYLAVGVFFLNFFYGSFAVLFLMDPVQLSRLGQLFQYFRLFFDAGILLFLAWNLCRWLKVDGAIKKAPLLAGLLIYGLETDIDTSVDGVLFLMHDSTLARTTDVSQVFPRRVNDPAETFTWNELSRLDAGSWFDRREVSSRELIPTLQAMLQVVKEKNLHFIYDLRIPCAGHPYNDRTLNLCLEEIRAAGVTDQTWVLAKPNATGQIHSILPNAILAAGIDDTEIPPSPESLVASGYRVVNSAYGLPDSQIHAYQDAGLWVNLWVMDEPWQYSRLWLAGADSVTSNNIQGLLAMPHPVLALPYDAYLAIWDFLGLIAALVYWLKDRGA